MSDELKYDGTETVVERTVTFTYRIPYKAGAPDHILENVDVTDALDELTRYVKLPDVSFSAFSKRLSPDENKKWLADNTRIDETSETFENFRVSADEILSFAYAMGILDF